MRFIISDERIAEVEKHLDGFHQTRYLISQVAMLCYDQAWIDETPSEEMAKLIVEFHEEEMEYFDWMEFSDGETFAEWLALKP